MEARSYIAWVRAIPGKFLLGGVKYHESSRFQSIEDARDWAWAIQSNQAENVLEYGVCPSHQAHEIASTPNEHYQAPE